MASHCAHLLIHGALHAQGHDHVRRREGRYLLRTNLSADNPELLWRCYMQLVFVEEAFRTLKGDLGLRPIYHHKPQRIEAHLFVAFLAYCLSITLRQRLKALAGGLMPRVVFEKLATLQLLDVRVPTKNSRAFSSALPTSSPGIIDSDGM